MKLPRGSMLLTGLGVLLLVVAATIDWTVVVSAAGRGGHTETAPATCVQFPCTPNADSSHGAPLFEADIGALFRGIHR